MQKNWRMESALTEEAGLSKAELFYRGMDRTISALENSGKQVVLIIDIPELDFMPERCLKRPATLSPPPACAVKKSRVMARSSNYRAIMQRLAQSHPQALLFDPYNYLCDANYCYAGNETMLYYRDSHHLSRRGSVMLMAHLVVWLDKQR